MHRSHQELKRIDMDNPAETKTAEALDVKDAQERKRLDDGGYTLTEMLVVILVISLIAAVLTPSLLGQLGRARAKTASLQVESTATAIGLFKDDTGRLPTTEEGLGVLVTDPGIDGWLGPYLKSDKALNDPWNRPLVYAPTDTGATVTSLGADGKAGGKGIDLDLSSGVQ